MQPPSAAMYQEYDMPPELCARPLALVGFSGLDTLNNAIHKSVWEMFSSNRRVERAPVAFKLISNAHEFPVIKPKRNSYDWYHPKGILKKNWMNKYLNEVPAIVVVFYDLDWNDAHWTEKMIECASRVQSMRAALDGRNTRITVVLIQSSLPLPAGEDVLASERAVALCASCELNSKSLFVLPHGDHLQGYVVRLENAFYDLAQNYYHLEAKNVKSHRDHLNKTTHQYLFVRHQFKMGFLSELKQDSHTAHKHYTHAYNNLLEIRIVDTNAMEVRTVAGFINYKLCKIMFALNLPRDSISQFKSHTDRFKSRIGFQELAFEHYAWLSKQFSVFGDIFDEAVKLGLPAVQTQHPGIYYQQAAQLAIQRKKTCQELCTDIVTYPSPDPLDGWKHMEFYGQRPWRPGKLTAEPPDPQMEINGIKALQFLEKSVNHSSQIISLYGLAISQYKTYRCPRTRRFLVLQMADEYYNSRDYGKALTLLTHMLWDFRSEKWWSILTDIIVKAMKCAYLVANIQDYLLLSLEILGTCVTVTAEDKKRVYYNLNRLLKKQMPESEPLLPEQDADGAIKSWKTALAVDNVCVSIDMGSIVSCIACKARFMEPKYEVDKNIFVELYIRNSAPYPLSFTRLSVTINTPSYSSEFAVDNDKLENPTLEFKSQEVKRFLVEFFADPNDLEKEIQIASVNLLMGNFTDCSIDLKFDSGGNGVDGSCSDFVYVKTRKNDKINFDSIRPLSTTLIIPRHSNLSIRFDHDKPALVGEWYEISVALVNEENFLVRNLEIHFSLADADSELIEFSTNMSKPNATLPYVTNISTIPKGNEKVLKFYLRMCNTNERNITVKVFYTLGSEKPMASIKEEVLNVPVVIPFEVDAKFLSSLLEDITKCYVGEDFAIMPIVKCVSPWPILIESTLLKFLSPVESADSNVESQISGMTLSNKESGTEMYLAKVQRQCEQVQNFGIYTVKWKRLNGHLTTTEVSITGLPIDWIPLDLKLNLPAYGLVRTPLLITYHLHNRSTQLIQLDVSMEASDAFMFAGYKQVSLLPESVKILKYNLYPLVAGSVALPKINLNVPENSTEGPALREEQLRFLVERSLPTHLFVMPQVKGTPKLTVNFDQVRSTATISNKVPS